MKEMKRILCLILCFVMLVGLVPVSAMAVQLDKIPAIVGKLESAATNDPKETEPEVTEPEATEPEPTEPEVTEPEITEAVLGVEVENAIDPAGVIDAAIVFTDLHTANTTTETNAKKSTIDAIMGTMKNTGMPFSSVTSGGDAFSVNSSWDKMTNDASVLTGYIRNALGDSSMPVNYVWSDHDRKATGLDGTSRLVYSGNYYVYALSMADICTYDRYSAGFNYSETSNNRTGNGFTATVPEAIQNFKNTVKNLDKTKPLFIVSHQPLIDNRNDNGWAEDWCDAINEVATQMDVAFFYGHNHKYELNSETGEYEYYRAKGSVIKVASRKMMKNGKQTDWNYDYQTGSGSTYNYDLVGVEKTLNFAHICAGYLDPHSTGSYKDATTRENTAVAAVIYEDSIKFISGGTGTYYTGNFALNETMTRDHAAPVPVTKTEADDLGMVAVSATALKLTGLTVTNMWEHENLPTSVSEALADYMAVRVDLQGVDSGAEVAYEMTAFGEIPLNGLELYHVAEDGTMTPISYTVNTLDTGVNYLVFSTDLTGIFAYGQPALPEGYALSRIFVDSPVTNYFVGDSLDMVTPTVYAIYTKADCEDIVREIYILDDYATTDGYTFSGYDMTKTGAQIVTVTYGDCSTSFGIRVWSRDIPNGGSGVGVTLGGGEFGVTGINVTESTNKKLATAIANELVTGTYVAYDISLTYAPGYAAGDGEKTVTMPIPAGVTNPAVFYVSDDGKTVENMNAVKNEDGTVSFVTTHFSLYVVGQSTSIEVPDPQPATQTTTKPTTKEKTVYVLVETIDEDGQYLLVNKNTVATDANMLTATNNGVGNTNNTTIIKGTDQHDEDVFYIETVRNNNAIWSVSASGNGWTLKANNRNLRNDNNNLTTSRNNSTTWTAGNNTLSSGTRYVRFNNNSWSLNNGSGTVYFYKLQEITLKEETEVTTNYSLDVKYDTQDAVDLFVENDDTITLRTLLNITGDGAGSNDKTADATYTTTFADIDGTTVNADPNGIIESIVDGVVTFSGKAGKAVIKASYDVNGSAEGGEVTDYIHITARAAGYEMEMCAAEIQYVAAPDEFDPSATYFIRENGAYKRVDIEQFEDGVVYYIIAAAIGEEITDVVSLKGIKKGDSYSVWAKILQYSSEHPNGQSLDVPDDTLVWTVSDPSMATVDPATGMITFTGKKYGTFTLNAKYYYDGEQYLEDEIEIYISASEYITPGDRPEEFPQYPAQGAVRFDKNAVAVGNFSETGIAKVELSMTGIYKESKLDVVLMLDRSSSMYKSGVQHRISDTVTAAKEFVKKIAKNEDGSFTGNRILVMDFLGGNLDRNEGGGSSHQFEANTYTSDESKGYQVINTDTELNALLKKIEEDFKGQTSLYGTEYAEGLKLCHDALEASREDGNKQFCVFMSDGIPNYMMGEKTHFKKTDDIVATFDVTGTNTASATVTRNTTKYEYEYYSSEMKKDGVTVFTVGLGLQSTNSAWSSASKEACEQVASMLLNDISGPAYETTRDTGNTVSKLDKYFFSVTDANAATGMTNAFVQIGNTIMKAATDVVVEDKIGNDYSVNFSTPNEKLDPGDMDGLENFYIQVVEYKLDANNERILDKNGMTVLENFTFSLDGTLESHTVGTNTCANCDHVAFNASGEIIGINGNYFDYKSDATGEYLTWTADELTKAELALQYFAYLENSSGVNVQQQVAAGTYYTNEWATLTYTNYKGNRVEQYFPVPQMTWQGAQASYVFYLVNENGQPVNLAGKVVPFSEAVYVTDTYTSKVVWNSMEQSVALEANHLAEDLVPDVFALYDQNATYMIHVYADEEGYNLNNHFTIDGREWTDAEKAEAEASGKVLYTTKVFNTKQDAKKYSENGTYIAANETDDNSYLCKGEGQISGITFVTVENLTKEEFLKDVYYLDKNGAPAYAPEYIEGASYFKMVGTDVTYTAADDETQWKYEKEANTAGGTKIGDYIYYVDEYGKIYTIVEKTNGTKVRTGFDFANTTVAFAVVWKPELKEDTVVVDFGLDVVVDVITNDNMVAGVVGVRADEPKNGDETVTMNTGAYTSAAKNATLDLYIDANDDTKDQKELKIGTATINADNRNIVRVSLEKANSQDKTTNGMQFNKPIEFYYESSVEYYENDELQSAYMYSKVTVIPAATVYYEDDFLVYSNSSQADATYGTWTEVGTRVDATQAQDRPGASKISAALDADNIYGYDSAYTAMGTYSMGSAKKVTVKQGVSGMASFDFYGTGFDVISMTTSDTGLILVQVLDASGNAVCKYTVDTYYGMLEDGTLEVNAPDVLYQVPVIKVSGLEYGKYTAKIIASYQELFDHDQNDGNGSYDFYLDAIRIYDPTGVANGATTNKIVSDAYVADGEQYPRYQELRNLVIDASGYVTKNEDGSVTINDEAELPGVVFIDANNEVTSVEEYINFGPNNELYLMAGQSITFQLSEVNKSNISDIRIALKVGNGGVVSYKIYDSETTTKAEAETKTLTTATDLYYSIKDLADGTIVITNCGKSGILSITNINYTFTANPDAKLPRLQINEEGLNNTLFSLRAPVIEDTEPEVTEPEATEPETTEPEETKPGNDKPGNRPGNNRPGNNKPGSNRPGNGGADAGNSGASNSVLNQIVETVSNILNALFGQWFN